MPSLLGLPTWMPYQKQYNLPEHAENAAVSKNPFFFKGKAGEGIGGPHAGKVMIWPLGIIMRGLTSKNNEEIKHCIAC